MGLVRDLKQRDGTGIRLCGGGKPAARLLGEIDEPVIKRNPIVLGITLFDGPFAPSPSRSPPPAPSTAAWRSRPTSNTDH
ncbi:hypothetical protein ACFQX6_30470 [Streptosporangium lutulentum]